MHIFLYSIILYYYLSVQLRKYRDSARDYNHSPKLPKKLFLKLKILNCISLIMRDSNSEFQCIL